MISGFGLDYQKCFDMMQLIVFALARAHGMHEDVLRPLQAMYKQLKRAFRFVGCLGSWFRATNGVLQGCPMSAVLINLLTTVWKRRIRRTRRWRTVRTVRTAVARRRR